QHATAKPMTAPMATFLMTKSTSKGMSAAPKSRGPRPANPRAAAVTQRRDRRLVAAAGCFRFLRRFERCLPADARPTDAREWKPPASSDPISVLA
ncbi:hypothetical protein, partial [Mesorhizobium sp.]|uniref:hypothetical protein n=1 Tax=Mesorhizobium sp. TaxID=1871066 RepID=UPI0025B8D36D